MQNNNIMWVLVANASEAKLYEAAKISNEWKLVKEFNHPESRKKGLDLISDKMGRFEMRTQSVILHSAYDETRNPKDIEAEHFACEIAHELKSGHASNKYHKLIMVAPPHFHGLLNKHCDSRVLGISKHVIKDYTKLKGRELKSQVHEQIKLS